MLPRRLANLRIVLLVGICTIVVALVAAMSYARYVADYENALREHATTARILSTEVLGLLSSGIGGANYTNVSDESALRLYESAPNLTRFWARGATDARAPYEIQFDRAERHVTRVSYEPGYEEDLTDKLADVRAALDREPDNPQYGRLQEILFRKYAALKKDQAAVEAKNFATDCRDLGVGAYRLHADRAELHLLESTRNEHGGSACLVFDVAQLSRLPLAILQQTLPTALGALAAGLAMALLLTAAVLRPLKRLSTFVRTHALDGASTATLEVPGFDREDEIGTLAQAFEAQIKAIRAHVDELETKRSEAESASAAKSAFLATMSHEIRTPLNGVLGMTELALTDKLDESKRELLETARSSGELLLAIINDILDLSKIEAEKVELEILDVSVEPLLRQTIATVRPKAAGKDLALEFKVDAAVPEVLRLDPIRIKQVLINLVGNAVKFTAKGGVYISVARGSEERVRFEVKDTGIGIPEEVRDGLFERFAQADASTTRQYGGTGLGLAICRGLVEGSMGGKIGVESEPGDGCTFWFEIPLVEGRIEDTPKRLYDSSNLPTASRAMNVLLVDDNAVNRAVAVRMLRLLGHDVAVAKDGVEAVDAARERRFDLIFMDAQMPRMDGLEATRRILALQYGGARTPIVGLTANVGKEDRANCMGAGMVEVLGKPIRIKDLAKSVQRWSIDEPTKLPTYS